ncbi:MAG: hypothetical protein Q4A66_03895, partial [Eubacteriales bacterium]|nr:hypothetical protein [Eubacteriales bacterium]
FWCGANLTCSNMQLSCSPNATRPTHIALFSCVTALFGATLGSLAGGALLETWNSRGMFLGAIDRYQVLCIVSVVLRLGFTLLLVPRFDRDNDAGPKDVLRHMASSVLGLFPKAKRAG